MCFAENFCARECPRMEKNGYTKASGMAIIKSDKEKMEDWLDGSGADVVLGREEIEVLNTCVNAKLTMQSNEEAINVCETIRKMNEEAMAALGIPEHDRARIAGRRNCSCISPPAVLS